MNSFCTQPNVGRVFVKDSSPTPSSLHPLPHPMEPVEGRAGWAGLRGPQEPWPGGFSWSRKAENLGLEA